MSISIDSEFLAPQEIRRMTSSMRIDDQENFLHEHGIPHRRIGRRILVSRAHTRAWLEGSTLIRPRGGINLGAIR